MAAVALWLPRLPHHCGNCSTAAALLVVPSIILKCACLQSRRSVACMLCMRGEARAFGEGRFGAVPAAENAAGPSQQVAYNGRSEYYTQDEMSQMFKPKAKKVRLWPASLSAMATM